MKSLYLSTIIGLILSTSAHSQSDSTRYWLNLDGYAEANIRKQRQYDLYEHNIYAIGALTFNIGKGWSITGEAEFDNDSFSATQYYASKEFSNFANIKIGQFTVPIGHTIPYNKPEHHLTVFLPEGEDNIIPYSWDQPGISFLGEINNFAYELDLLYENHHFAAAVRVDNYSFPDTRLSASFYHGKTYLYHMDADLKDHHSGNHNLLVCSVDYDLHHNNLISHGHATYTNIRDTDRIRTHEVSAGIEGGYDIHHFIPFLRYDYTLTDYDFTVPPTPYRHSHRMAAGINYNPFSPLYLKVEYSHYYHTQGPNEDFIQIGIAFTGAVNFFSKR